MLLILPQRSGGPIVPPTAGRPSPPLTLGLSPVAVLRSPPLTVAHGAVQLGQSPPTKSAGTEGVQFIGADVREYGAVIE